MEQFDAYEAAKQSIIRAYEITPEAYRQKFRSLSKPFSQTFTEFASEKFRYFKKWIDSTGTATFQDIIDLLVLEEVKNKMHMSILNHVEERGATKLERAAKVIDAISLLVWS